MILYLGKDEFVCNSDKDVESHTKQIKKFYSG